MEIDSEDEKSRRPLFILHAFTKKLRLSLDQPISEETIEECISNCKWTDTLTRDVLTEISPSTVHLDYNEIAIDELENGEFEDDETDYEKLSDFRPRDQNVENFTSSLKILYRFGKSIKDYVYFFKDAILDHSNIAKEMPGYDDTGLGTPTTSKKTHESNTSPRKKSSRGKNDEQGGSYSPTPERNSNYKIKKNPGKHEMEILEILQFTDAVGARLILPSELTADGLMIIKMELLEPIGIKRTAHPPAIVEWGFRLIFDGLRNLQILRKHQIVHADLHPSNIMFSQTKNRFVLIDFGYSVFFGGAVKYADNWTNAFVPKDYPRTSSGAVLVDYEYDERAFVNIVFRCIISSMMLFVDDLDKVYKRMVQVLHKSVIGSLGLKDDTANRRIGQGKSLCDAAVSLYGGYIQIVELMTELGYEWDDQSSVFYDLNEEDIRQMFRVESSSSVRKIIEFESGATLIES